MPPRRPLAVLFVLIAWLATARAWIGGGSSVLGSGGAAGLAAAFEGSLRVPNWQPRAQELVGALRRDQGRGLAQTDAAALPVRSKDWRKEGKVTPVKDQGGCEGGSWAFAAVAAVESAYLISINASFSPSTAPLDLSEQQLLSCISRADSLPTEPTQLGAGCAPGGGFVGDALLYAALVNLTTEAAAPYQADASGSCESLGLATRPARQREAVQLAAWPEAPVVLPAGAPGAPAEAQVMALVDQQPLVFQLPGGLPSLERYTGGVVDLGGAASCSPSTLEATGASLTLALLVVGYESTGDPRTSYWIAKNSRGASWGDKGYVRLRMTGDASGPCGAYGNLARPPLTFSRHLASISAPPPPPFPPPAPPPPPGGAAVVAAPPAPADQGSGGGSGVSGNGTTTTTTTGSSGGGSGGLSGGALAGIVLGSTIGAVLIMAACLGGVLYVRRRRSQFLLASVADAAALPAVHSLLPGAGPRSRAASLAGGANGAAPGGAAAAATAGAAAPAEVEAAPAAAAGAAVLTLLTHKSGGVPGHGAVAGSSGRGGVEGEAGAGGAPGGAGGAAAGGALHGRALGPSAVVLHEDEDALGGAPRPVPSMFMLHGLDSAGSEVESSDGSATERGGAGGAAAAGAGVRGSLNGREGRLSMRLSTRHELEAQQEEAQEQQEQQQQAVGGAAESVAALAGVAMGGAGAVGPGAGLGIISQEEVESPVNSSEERLAVAGASVLHCGSDVSADDDEEDDDDEPTPRPAPLDPVPESPLVAVPARRSADHDSDASPHAGERQQAVEIEAVEPHVERDEVEEAAGGEGGVAASVPVGAAAQEHAADVALDRSSEDSGLELPLPPSHVAAGGLPGASRGAASRPAWRP